MNMNVLQFDQCMKSFMVYFPTHDNATIFDQKNIILIEFEHVMLKWVRLVQCAKKTCESKLYIWQLKHIRSVWDRLRGVTKHANMFENPKNRPVDLQCLNQAHLLIQDVIHTHVFLLNKIDQKISSLCSQTPLRSDSCQLFRQHTRV